MKCSKCGAEIEVDKFFCSECGQAVQLVPDYNPEEELLSSEVTESELVAEPEASGSEDSIPSDRDKKPAKKKSRHHLKLAVTVFICAVVIVIGVCIWLGRSMRVNTYDYQIEQAQERYAQQEYEKALDHAENAAGLNKRQTEPYMLMAAIYLDMDETNKAISALEQVLELDKEAEEAYGMLISIYEEEEKLYKISQLLEDAPTVIREAFPEYIAVTPEFSVDEMTHNTEIEVELLVEEGIIYYTLDNTTPDEEDGLLYSEPIEVGEGTTTIRAISINEKGIVSNEVKMTYEIIFDLPDAPLIEPATGTYTEALEVVVTAGTDETIYYTLDGSDPTTDSARYSGPVQLDENKDYVFSAIAVGQNGKASGITRRSYDVRIVTVVDDEEEPSDESEPEL